MVVYVVGVYVMALHHKSYNRWSAADYCIGMLLLRWVLQPTCSYIHSHTSKQLNITYDTRNRYIHTYIHTSCVNYTRHFVTFRMPHYSFYKFKLCTYVNTFRHIYTQTHSIKIKYQVNNCVFTTVLFC